MAKPILTIKEAAAEYQMPEHAVRTLVKRGAFPVMQFGRRCYITREAFEAYLKTGGEMYHSEWR